MGSLVQQIERYIKQMLRQSDGLLRLQRNELANEFKCVPSQISYVLNTRFTIERGYLVESQRGGGGFVEIRRIIAEHPEGELFLQVIEQVGDQVDQHKATHLIKNLEENELITKRESAILLSVLHRRNLKLDLPYRDFLRAALLKAALGAIMKSEDGE